MHRIDADGHLNNQFVAQNPSTGQRATATDAAWFNSVQEELCTVITGAGIALNKNATNQLLLAIQSMVTKTVPSGVIAPFAGNAAPTGYLIANGQAISRETYPDLWVIAQTNLAADATDFTNNPGKFGRGNGTTTFQVPDLRGKFIRGLDAGAGIDATRALGTYQQDAMQNVTGAVGPLQFRNTPTVSGAFALGATGANGNDSSGGDVSRTVNFDLSTAPGIRTATETRPKNIALNYIIKT